MCIKKKIIILKITCHKFKYRLQYEINLDTSLFDKKGMLK